MNTLLKTIGLLAGWLCLSVQFVQAASETEPTRGRGATVFKERCVLCHGSVGMGEGMLPMSLKNYPATNLLKPKHGGDADSLRKIIIWGGSKGKMNIYSPPWGDELTWTEIESVVLFVQHLRDDTEAALELLKKQAAVVEVASLKIGRTFYQSRCAMCHGKGGEGNGRMAKIIKNPPPFDLTKSIVPDDYLKEVINKGGAALGRSPRMPPWVDELSPVELDSVILYIKTLRD